MTSDPPARASCLILLRLIMLLCYPCNVFSSIYWYVPLFTSSVLLRYCMFIFIVLILSVKTNFSRTLPITLITQPPVTRMSYNYDNMRIRQTERKENRNSTFKNTQNATPANLGNLLFKVLLSAALIEDSGLGAHFNVQPVCIKDICIPVCAAKSQPLSYLFRL